MQAAIQKSFSHATVVAKSNTAKILTERTVLLRGRMHSRLRKIEYLRPIKNAARPVEMKLDPANSSRTLWSAPKGKRSTRQTPQFADVVAAGEPISFGANITRVHC